MDKEPPKRRFKRLTGENWLLRDETVDHFVRMLPNGETLPISENEWAQMILSVELSLDVPLDVRHLFEVAQGVLCYGCFYYPLYTIGIEQSYRVLDAALAQKCEFLGLSQESDRFVGRIECLHKHGYMSDQRRNQWHAGRQLRNYSSHARRQSLMMPSQAIDALQTAADLIEALFKK